MVNFIIPILKFVKDNWKVTIVSILAVSLFFYVDGLRDDVTQLTNELKLANQQIEMNQFQIELCADANKVLRDQISGFNNVISDWSKVSQQHIAKMEGLTVIINKQHQSVTAQISKILAGEQPQTCEDAIQYLIYEANK